MPLTAKLGLVTCRRTQAAANSPMGTSEVLPVGAPAMTPTYGSASTWQAKSDRQARQNMQHMVSDHLCTVLRCNTTSCLFPSYLMQTSCLFPRHLMQTNKPALPECPAMQPAATHWPAAPDRLPCSCIFMLDPTTAVASLLQCNVPAALRFSWSSSLRAPSTCCCDPTAAQFALPHCPP